MVVVESGVEQALELSQVMSPSDILSAERVPPLRGTQDASRSG
jgi:hypothetical protein